MLLVSWYLLRLLIQREVDICTITLYVGLKSVNRCGRQSQSHILRCRMNCQMLTEVSGLRGETNFIKIGCFLLFSVKGTIAHTVIPFFLQWKYLLNLENISL